MVRSARSDRHIARTSDMGLPRNPHPPMPMVIPGCNSATTSAAVISFCLTAASFARCCPARSARVLPCAPRSKRLFDTFGLTILSRDASAICPAQRLPGLAQSTVKDMSREPAGRHDPILAVAAGLFARNGVAAPTVREIADEVGILSGSLYHHFDSKEATVDELLAPDLNDLRA